MAELVDQSLRSFRLLHDALFVVLPDGSRQLVIVHRWSILATSPQAGNSHGVLDLKHSLGSVQPSNRCAVLLRIGEQLFEKLPQMDVGTSLASGFGGRQDDCGGGGGGAGSSGGHVRRCVLEVVRGHSDFCGQFIFIV